MTPPNKIEFVIGKPKVPKSKDNSPLISMLTVISLIKLGGNNDVIGLKKLYYLYDIVDKRWQSTSITTLISRPFDIPGRLRGIIVLLNKHALTKVEKRSGKLIISLTSVGKERYESFKTSEEFQSYLERIRISVSAVTDTNLDKQQLRW